MKAVTKKQARAALEKLLAFFGDEAADTAGPLARVESRALELADDGGGRAGSLAFYPYQPPTRCREIPGVGLAHVGSFPAWQCGDCLCGAVRLCGCGRCIQDARGGKGSPRPDTPVLELRRLGGGTWGSRD